MRSTFTFLVLATATLSLQAQNGALKHEAHPANTPGSETQAGEGTVRKLYHIAKAATINFSDIKTDFDPALMIREMPKQGSSKMEFYNYPENYTSRGASQSQSTLPELVKGDNFFANSWGVSTPNDNDMAISDSGDVVSVVNTNIYIRNVVTGASTPNKSLAAFSSALNISAGKFDPKVIYDPVNDRFIMVFLAGFNDATSKVILAFTAGNDPAGAWNLYSLPGNPLNNNLWTDYPMIAMTEKEVFLTVNLLYNDSTWQAGFVETLVWQINKNSGYSGGTLASQLHSNIKFNGKAIRNLCPVKGGSKLYSPGMYFISNRNLAFLNDTVFLVKITDTINAPGQNVNIKALTSSQAYYFPPDGTQTASSQSLATNDSRNLGAFYENGMIQYVHNTKHPVNNHCTVYYGTIANPDSANPVVDGYLLENDSMDFAYPNISYAGIKPGDNKAIITFNHSSSHVKAGCSAVMAEGTANFSPILKLKDGINHIDLLQSDLERWGDYTGSQRRYAFPGEIWMSGYYGYYYSASWPNAHGTWISQVLTEENIHLGLSKPIASRHSAGVFPNPSNGYFSVSLSLSQPELLSFELFDASGRSVALLLRDMVTVNHNTFSFNTRDLGEGVYFLSISGDKGTRISKKIIVN